MLHTPAPEELHGAFRKNLWVQRLPAGASFVSTAELEASNTPRAETVNVSHFLVAQSFPCLDCCSAYSFQGPRGIRSSIGQEQSVFQRRPPLAHTVPEQRAAGAVSEGLRWGVCFPANMELSKPAAFNGLYYCSRAVL